MKFPLSFPDQCGVYVEMFPHLSVLLAEGQYHSLHPLSSPQFIHTLSVSGVTFLTSVGSLYPSVFSFLLLLSLRLLVGVWPFFRQLGSSGCVLGFIGPPRLISHTVI